MDYFLAIDIGASSGRHMLGHLEDGKLVVEEIHRFPNGMIEIGGRLCWDHDALYREILTGMKKCAAIGKIPVSVGIDTWGVDFVLLDEHMRMIDDAVAYRDSRTDGMFEEVAKCISDKELYARVGLQKMSFNTIYQLMAIKTNLDEPQTHKLLFIPDYFHYLLSGVYKTEYTIASTSGLINAERRDWDDEIIKACGFPRHIFGEIVPPGTVLGDLHQGVQDYVGYNCKVVTPASHDTQSAVMSVPADSDQPLFISSGTWSIMGVERPAPDCSEASRLGDFTNEGGYGGTYCYMRNIMGLWMIQCIKTELGDEYSFAQLCDMAQKSSIASIVNVNEARFMAPDSMIGALQIACDESGQAVPVTPGELAAVVYNSLAMYYRDTARELEALTGTVYDTIYIVGGGSNAAYLNNLTARYTGKTIHAGPGEATAIGNIAAQMIALGAFVDLAEARTCIRHSI